MPRRPTAGQCVHCLKIFDSLTWDHLFPVSWYPNTTPTNLEKWKFPSCESCNNKYGKTEEELLWRLGLCVGCKDARSSGISDRVIQSLNPNYAKTDRERLARQRKREKVIQETEGLKKSIKEFPAESILPNFGPQDNLEYSKCSIVPVPVEELRSFGCKLIRGISYICDKSFIGKDYVIDIFFVHDTNSLHVLKLIEKFGKNYYRGPGIRIGRAVTIEDSISSIYAIEIWGKLKIYGTVTKRERGDVF